MGIGIGIGTGMGKGVWGFLAVSESICLVTGLAGENEEIYYGIEDGNLAPLFLPSFLVLSFLPYF